MVNASAAMKVYGSAPDRWMPAPTVLEQLQQAEPDLPRSMLTVTVFTSYDTLAISSARTPHTGRNSGPTVELTVSGDLFGQGSRHRS